MAERVCSASSIFAFDSVFAAAQNCLMDAFFDGRVFFSRCVGGSRRAGTHVFEVLDQPGAARPAGD